MQIVKTIELTEKERETICDFLGIVDKISDAARCSMADVFLYLANEADYEVDGTYSIKALHNLDKIGV